MPQRSRNILIRALRKAGIQGSPKYYWSNTGASTLGDVPSSGTFAAWDLDVDADWNVLLVVKVSGEQSQPTPLRRIIRVFYETDTSKQYGGFSNEQGQVECDEPRAPRVRFASEVQSYYAAMAQVSNVETTAVARARRGHGGEQAGPGKRVPDPRPEWEPPRCSCRKCGDSDGCLCDVDSGTQFGDRCSVCNAGDPHVQCLCTCTDTLGDRRRQVVTDGDRRRQVATGGDKDVADVHVLGGATPSAEYRNAPRQCSCRMCGGPDDGCQNNATVFGQWVAAVCAHCTTDGWQSPCPCDCEYGVGRDSSTAPTTSSTAPTTSSTADLQVDNIEDEDDPEVDFYATKKKRAEQRKKVRAILDAELKKKGFADDAQRARLAHVCSGHVPMEDWCLDCGLAKQRRKAHRRDGCGTHRARCWHADTFGPVTPPGDHGERHGVVLVSEEHDTPGGGPIRTKASSLVKDELVKFAAKLGAGPMNFYTDGGTEYKGHVDRYIADQKDDNGSTPVHHSSTRYSPWRNGRSESMVQQVKDHIRVSLAQGKPRCLWPYAMKGALACLELVAGATEMLHGEDYARSQAKLLAPFGCVVTVVREGDERSGGGTFGEKSWKGFYILARGDRVQVGRFDKNNKITIVESQNVKVFRELEFDWPAAIKDSVDADIEFEDTCEPDETVTWAECTRCKKWRRDRGARPVHV